MHVDGGSLTLDGVSFDKNRAETHQVNMCVPSLCCPAFNPVPVHPRLGPCLGFALVCSFIMFLGFQFTPPPACCFLGCGLFHSPVSDFVAAPAPAPLCAISLGTMDAGFSLIPLLFFFL